MSKVLATRPAPEPRFTTISGAKMLDETHDFP
jgi:hypothetical protein